MPKQYRMLGGKTVLRQAAERLLRAADEARVVIAAGHESLYEAAVQSLNLGAPIIGGPARQQSVRNGLEAVAAEG